jgi:hypothetical protein
VLGTKFSQLGEPSEPSFPRANASTNGPTLHPVLCKPPYVFSLVLFYLFSTPPRLITLGHRLKFPLAKPLAISYSLNDAILHIHKLYSTAT